MADSKSSTQPRRTEKTRNIVDDIKETQDLLQKMQKSNAAERNSTFKQHGVSSSVAIMYRTRWLFATLILICMSCVVWMNFDTISLRAQRITPMLKNDRHPDLNPDQNPDQNPETGLEAVVEDSSGVSVGSEMYMPNASYTLPKAVNWEYDEKVTYALAASQKFPPNGVNRYVGGGAWVKVKVKPDLGNLLLNDLGEAWVPYDCEGADWCKDGVKKMDYDFACSEMERLGLKRILVLGESLERHLFQTLAVVFSGDYVAGSLKEGLSKEELKKCSGDMQFSEKSCRTMGTHSLTTCGGKLHLEMKEAYNVKYADYGLRAAKEFATLRSDLLIAGVGLHDNLLRPNSVIQSYLKFMLKDLRKSKAKSTFVWFSVHAINSRQQPKHRGRQKLEILYDYNNALEATCEQEGLDYINSFLLTMGQKSYDGVHFESKVNLIRGTLFLWQFFRNGAIKPLTS